jgi:ABC-type lipoprotein export system ATPase subunit
VAEASAILADEPTAALDGPNGHAIMTILSAMMVDRCDVLVVDTPGWTDKSTLALARKSTFMVIKPDHAM